MYRVNIQFVSYLHIGLCNLSDSCTLVSRLSDVFALWKQKINILKLDDVSQFINPADRNTENAT